MRYRSAQIRLARETNHKCNCNYTCTVCVFMYNTWYSTLHSKHCIIIHVHVVHIPAGGVVDDIIGISVFEGASIDNREENR